MINIDKVIDEYNETLEERIAKELYGDIIYTYWQEKIKNDNPNITEDTITVSTADSNISFYQVLDENGNPPEIPSSITTIASYGEITTPTIKETDQTRIIKFMANDLLNALGLPPGDKDRKIELKVKVVGRDCDKYGQPINID